MQSKQVSLSRKGNPIFYLEKYLFSFIGFISINCASLLPPEQRVYPQNPVSLTEELTVIQWLEKNQNQNPGRFWWTMIGEKEYKFTYIRREPNSLGSFIACSSLVKSIPPNSMDLYNLVSMVNYADYTKSRKGRGGDLGPMSEMEKSEILLPCIEELLDQ
jgi:hypothetical protein